MALYLHVTVDFYSNIDIGSIATVDYVVGPMRLQYHSGIKTYYAAKTP